MKWVSEVDLKCSTFFWQINKMPATNQRFILYYLCIFLRQYFCSDSEDLHSYLIFNFLGEFLFRMTIEADIFCKENSHLANAIDL